MGADDDQEEGLSGRGHRRVVEVGGDSYDDSGGFLESMSRLHGPLGGLHEMGLDVGIDWEDESSCVVVVVVLGNDNNLDAVQGYEFHKHGAEVVTAGNMRKVRVQNGDREDGWPWETRVDSRESAPFQRVTLKNASAHWLNPWMPQGLTKSGIRGF